MPTPYGGTDANPYWYRWEAEGGSIIDTPRMAVVNNGYMLADYLDSNYQVQTAVYDFKGDVITGWQAESNGWQTNYPAQLAAYGATIYMLFTGLNNLVYYKQAYYNNN